MKFKHPLMHNNFTNQDFVKVRELLKKKNKFLNLIFHQLIVKLRKMKKIDLVKKEK